MSATNYCVARDGQTVLNIHGYIDYRGYLRGSRGDQMVVNGRHASALGYDLDDIKRLMLARDYDTLIARYPDALARAGTNPTGLVVTSYDDLRAAAETALTPGEREWRAIQTLRVQGQRINDRWDDEADTGVGYARLHEADRREAAWRAAYPAEAARVDAEHLRRRAARHRELATGALTYDADGWIDAAGQQVRHDAEMAKADALEAEAHALVVSHD